MYWHSHPHRSRSKWLTGKWINAAASGYEQATKESQSHLGEATKHNTYEGETVGAILATWLVDNTPDTAGKHVSMYIDNQSVLKAVAEPKATSGQYLLQSLAAMTNNSRAKLNMKWISGHSGVTGNEYVDKLAKEAAEGKASRCADLPPMLRTSLPTSASAIKQEHMDQLKMKWKATWLTSPRRTRFEQLDQTFPFTKYRKRLDKLTREQASRLMQIRSGHIPLNLFLFKINRSDTKLCRACQTEPDEETPTETVTHFLFECDAYFDHRRTLARTVGRNNLNLKSMMESTKGMKALANFVTKTGRFNIED